MHTECAIGRVNSDLTDNACERIVFCGGSAPDFYLLAHTIEPQSSVEVMAVVIVDQSSVPLRYSLT